MTPSSVSPLLTGKMTEKVERFPEGAAIKTLNAQKRYTEMTSA
jgi:hypothetical protein